MYIICKRHACIGIHQNVYVSCVNMLVIPCHLCKRYVSLLNRVVWNVIAPHGCDSAILSPPSLCDRVAQVLSGRPVFVSLCSTPVIYQTMYAINVHVCALGPLLAKKIRIHWITAALLCKHAVMCQYRAGTGTIWHGYGLF